MTGVAFLSLNYPLFGITNEPLVPRPAILTRSRARTANVRAVDQQVDMSEYVVDAGRLPLDQNVQGIPGIDRYVETVVLQS